MAVSWDGGAELTLQDMKMTDLNCCKQEAQLSLGQPTVLVVSDL